MTSKKFYTYVISKSKPIYLFLLFLPSCICLKVFYEVSLSYYLHFTCICISYIFIFEIISTFIRTIFILQKRKITDKARIRLYLFYIPYLPSIVGTIIYSLCLIKTKTLYYRSLILFIYAITSTLNYGFSMFLNTKLNIFRFISDDIEKDSNEEKVSKI